MLHSPMDVAGHKDADADAAEIADVVRTQVRAALPVPRTI